MVSGHMVWSSLSGRALRCLALCCALVGSAPACVRTSSADVSGEAPYRELIGSEYRVDATDVNAYFIRDNYPDREPTSVTLMSGVGVANRFVASKRHVEPGSIVRIVSVRRTWTLGGRFYYCIVEFENTDIARGLPVKVELKSRSGGGVELDPLIYKAGLH